MVWLRRLFAPECDRGGRQDGKNNDRQHPTTSLCASDLQTVISPKTRVNAHSAILLAVLASHDAR